MVAAAAAAQQQLAGGGDLPVTTLYLLQYNREGGYNLGAWSLHGGRILTPCLEEFS